MKTIGILGSTGSIGTQTLDVVRANGDISVKAIAAGSNIRLLEEQIREFNPAVCGVWDEERAEDLALRVRDTDTRIVSGMDGLMEIAAMDGYEILVTAVVGMIGIRPTMAAIKSGKDIALANKETLVTAGHLIVPLAREHQVRLLPVDSEHSAIFQCLNGEHRNKIDKILLTASGGPFRRPLPGLDQEADGARAGGGCLKASQLVHGKKDHHRQLHHGQQGIGSDGGSLAV